MSFLNFVSIIITSFAYSADLVTYAFPKAGTQIEFECREYDRSGILKDAYPGVAVISGVSNPSLAKNDPLAVSISARLEKRGTFSYLRSSWQIPFDISTYREFPKPRPSKKELLLSGNPPSPQWKLGEKRRVAVGQIDGTNTQSITFLATKGNLVRISHEVIIKSKGSFAVATNGKKVDTATVESVDRVRISNSPNDSYDWSVSYSPEFKWAVKTVRNWDDGRRIQCEAKEIKVAGEEVHKK